MKLFFALAAALPLALSAADIPEPQMLEPYDPSRARQRGAYPADAKKRISDAAVKDGFNFLAQGKLSEAMSEFNRAWRFAPDHYAAWWGAGIVRGKQAASAAAPDLQTRYLLDSVKLLEKAVSFAPFKEKINAQCDLAQSLSLCGMRLKSTGKSAEGDELLAKTKTMLDEMLKSAPASGRIRNQIAINNFCRADYDGALREIAEAERLGFSVDPRFKKDAETHKAAAK